jgi:hypothetical protein
MKKIGVTKRIGTLVVVGVVLISVSAFVLPSMAQNNVLSIGDIEVSLGSSIITPLLIHNATSVAGIDLYLTYDPAIVQVTAITVGDFDDSFGGFPLFDLTNAQNGSVRIAVAKIAGLSGDKIIANVELTAMALGGSDLTIDIALMTDDGGLELTGSTDDGTFTVSEAEPPIVKDPRVVPSIIPDDTDDEPLWGEVAEFSVNVSDESGIDEVTINLSSLGWTVSPMVNRSGLGAGVAVMFCIGNFTVDSTTWVPFNFSSNASNGTAGWNGTAYVPYCLPINATDIHGQANTSVCIQLTVMKNGDVTSDGAVNFGDGIRLINHYFYPGDTRYSLPSDTIADVTGDIAVNFGDGIRLINHYFYPADTRYILK